MKNKYTVLFILLFTFSACDDGWYSQKRWEGRRSSNSIADSKNRDVYLKKLHFKASNPKYNEQISFFLEKGYRWGYKSSKDTRKLKEEKKPYQVVGKFNRIKQKNSAFGDTLLVLNDYYTINKNFPVQYNFKDTLVFYLIVNRDMYKQDTISKIKVWNQENSH